MGKGVVTYGVCIVSGGAFHAWIHPFQDCVEMAAYRVVAGAGSQLECFNIGDDKEPRGWFSESYPPSWFG